MKMYGHGTFDAFGIPFLQKIHNKNMILISILRDHIQIKIQRKGLFNGLREHWHKTTDKLVVRCLQYRPMEGTL